ncbi:MAG: phosphate acyltransferase [Coriobacteriaceae bacterium]|nr:phosphate acyltransferase [Coriobacteriaceae bacterium]
MSEITIERLLPVVEKAKKVCPVIVFPEYTSPDVLKAASALAQYGIAKPIILGDVDEIRASGLDFTGCTLYDPSSEEGQAKKAEMAEKLAEKTGFPARIIQKKIKTTLDFAAAMTGLGEADILVSGHIFNTAQTITAVTIFIGLKPGVERSTCWMIVDIPSYQGPAGENQMFILSDTSQCFAETVDELVDVTINAAEGAKGLGWEPRVAMLSFSTMGSGKHAWADKVIEATKIVKERMPELAIDGEVQLDAAVVPAVAIKKCGEGSKVGGRANVLIFPTMDAGNIGIKLLQLLGDAVPYGPWLTGYNKPVVQLSRSFSAQTIFGSCVFQAAALDK